METITLAQGMKRIFEASGTPFTREDWLAMTNEDRKEWAQLIANTLRVEVVGYDAIEGE